MLDALKSGNFTKAERYTSEKLDFFYASRRTKKFYAAVMKTMSYSIISSETTDDRCEIVLALHIADISLLLDAVSRDMLAKSFINGKNSNIYDILADQIRSRNIPVITETLPIVLADTGDGWRIPLEPNREFFSALACGLV